MMFLDIRIQIHKVHTSTLLFIFFKKYASRHNRDSILHKQKLKLRF